MSLRNPKNAVLQKQFTQFIIIWILDLNINHFYFNEFTYYHFWNTKCFVSKNFFKLSTKDYRLGKLRKVYFKTGVWVWYRSQKFSGDSCLEEFSQLSVPDETLICASLYQGKSLIVRQLLSVSLSLRFIARWCWSLRQTFASQNLP